MNAESNRIARKIKNQDKEIRIVGDGIYLHDGDVVCRTGYDVYSYYYHTYKNNPLNLADLFFDGLCWKLKGSKDVIWYSKEIKDHPYGKSVKIQYWHEGNKVIAYTHPDNLK